VYELGSTVTFLERLLCRSGSSGHLRTRPPSLGSLLLGHGRGLIQWIAGGAAPVQRGLRGRALQARIMCVEHGSHL